MRFVACILALAVGSAALADTPLKQSTAVTVKLGPFVDSTDGVTAETGLTISQADVRLSKAGGDYAQKNESSAATHDELGEYDVDLDTTDTATLGPLRVMVQESGALPVWRDFVVMPANVYDSLYSTDRLQVDAVEVSGDSTAADNAETAFTGTITSFDALDTAQDTQHNTTRSLIGVPASDLATVLAAIEADTAELQTDWANGGRLDLILDTAASGSDPAILTTTIDGLTNQTTFSLTAGSADDDAYNGWSVLIIDQSTSTQVASGVISDYTGAGANVVLDEDPGVFTIATGDTVKIYRPSAVEGTVTVDGTVTATVSGTVSANLVQILGTAPTETTGGNIADNFSTFWDNADAATTNTVDDVGGGSGLDAAGVRAAVGLASANLDTQLSAIVTDTAEIGAAGAGLTAVPYNSAWDAEIQSEAADALAAYDGPTNAEMEARTLVAASYFDPAADEVDLGSVKGTALTETTGGNLADNISFFFDLDTTTTKTVNDVGVAGSGLTQADVRTAIGLASANLDTQLATAQSDLDTITGSDGVTLATTQGNYAPATAAALATVDGNVDSILTDTAEIGAAGAGLSAIPWNSSWDAETQSEVNDALVAIHLDHLLAVDYDPASKPGVGTALLNETVWNNSGLMQSTTIATLTSQTVGTLTAGSADDDAYNGHAVIITDQSTSTQKWAGVIEDYVGATKTFTLRSAPGFTIAAGDSIAILASQDGNVLDLISQTQNSITFSPDRDRTWVVRRNSTSKTITKRTDETAVFYVDCSKLMGTGEFLGAADTFSVNVNDSGCTVASGYPTKESGTIIGVKLSGGTSSDSAYTLDIEFQTDQGSEPIEASVKLLVVASETE